MLSSHLRVPAGMSGLRRFVHWRLEQHPRGGKPAKIPCDVRGGRIDPLDPDNWHTLEEIQTGYGLGAGFVFCQEDGRAFVDVDGCRDPETGALSDVARGVLEWFPGAAVEVSQSGAGIHVFFRYRPGSIPPDHRNKCAAAGVELYTRWRFCALTGDQLAGDADADFSVTMPAFLQRFGLEPLPASTDTAAGADQVDERYTGKDWSDDEVLDRMMRARGSVGARFGQRPHPQHLWHADPAALGAAYPHPDQPFDHSSADAALLSHLAYWTGRDGLRMERLFSRSALGQRDKWIRRPDYRRRSVHRAVNFCGRVYDRAPDQQRPAGQDDPAPEELKLPIVANLDEQRELFEGWIYVRNSHQILAPDGDLVRPDAFRAVLGGPIYVTGWAKKGAEELEKALQRGGVRRSNFLTQDPFEALTRSRIATWPRALDVCFRPQLEPNSIDADGMVNAWRPPQVRLVRASVEQFLRHVSLLLPAERDRAILLTWLQSAARSWGKKFQWALVVQGAEGNGKTLLLRCMRAALGRRYVHMPKASEIAEKYNDWIERKLFVGVEEIRISERREALEILKDMVTNEEVEVRAMHRNKRMADNFANFAFLTNYKDAVPTNRSDRRYATFFTAQQSVDDILRDMPGDYFQRLYGWLEWQDGYAAVADWLRHADLVAAEFDPAGACVRAPHTSSTAEAIDISRGRIEQEILEAVQDGRPGFAGGWISSAALEALLRDRSIRDVGPRRRAEIVRQLGYRHVGRSRVLVNGLQPRLYRADGQPDAPTDAYVDPYEFLSAQNR